MLNVLGAICGGLYAGAVCLKGISTVQKRLYRRECASESSAFTTRTRTLYRRHPTQSAPPGSTNLLWQHTRLRGQVGLPDLKPISVGPGHPEGNALLLKLAVDLMLFNHDYEIGDMSDDSDSDNHGNSMDTIRINNQHITHDAPNSHHDLIAIIPAPVPCLSTLLSSCMAAAALTPVIQTRGRIFLLVLASLSTRRYPVCARQVVLDQVMRVLWEDGYTEDVRQMAQVICTPC